MVVGSSVSRTACCKVFLNGHIWLLDRQCHGQHAAKFSWMVIYGRWIVSVTENVWRKFSWIAIYGIGSSVSRKCKFTSKFTEFCRSTIICDKVWVPKEIEKHCFDDAENCIGNKEKHQKREIRLARRREYCRRRNAAQRADGHESFRQRRAAYSTNAQDEVEATTSDTSIFTRCTCLF